MGGRYEFRPLGEQLFIFGKDYLSRLVNGCNFYDRSRFLCDKLPGNEFEKAVFNGGRDWLFSEELPRYLDMMAKMVFWGFIKSRNYQECDNTPITRIEGLWPEISK